MQRGSSLGRLLASSLKKCWVGLETEALHHAQCTLGKCRHFADLPTDYGRYYNNLEPPKRRVLPVSQQAGLQNSEDAGQEAQADGENAPAVSDSSAKLQQQSAASVSAWMFPWEKRQMDGQAGPLRSWEKIYWWIFVSAIAFFLYSRVSGKDIQDLADPEEAERKEKRKQKAARLLMAGQPLSEEDEEQFEGLTPKEIQDYVDKCFGKSRSSDPFEGMSPEEINEMLASAPTGQPVA